MLNIEIVRERPFEAKLRDIPVSEMDVRGINSDQSGEPIDTSIPCGAGIRD
jgi:hypothetical protein